MRGQTNILIVDDEPACARMLSRVVEKMRLTPLLATNISEARESLSRNHVRLILLDRMLGKGSDGLNFCLELKKDSQTRLIPVIVLTGMPESDEELKGYRYGADLYLRKPFSVAKLTRYIEAFLKRLPYKDEVGGRIVYENIILDSASQTIRIGGATFRGLPARQFEFLRVLASHKGEAVSRACLVKKLWKNRVRDKEVDVLVYRLRRRLGESAERCIEPVRSYGYRLRPLPTS
jgi:two-component system, OmpR family, phosphate regulon response regulator PhoB